MKCNLSDIQLGWVVIFSILLIQPFENNVFSQEIPTDTIYNQSYDWVSGYRDALPEWLFSPQLQGGVIGISDPCMKPEVARKQALQRAAYLYSLRQGASLNLLSDMFSTVETFVNTYEDQRNKILTLGVIEPPIQRIAYRIEKEYTSVYGEKFIWASFTQMDSCEFSYRSVSELMLLSTKERMEEKEIKFNLLLESSNGPEQSFQSWFQLKGALLAPKVYSYINGIPIRISQKGYWYKDIHCDEKHEIMDLSELKNGFWNAYVTSFVKALLSYPFSNVNSRMVDDNFNGNNSSSRGLHREKVVAFLSIIPLIKEIRSNQLCVDWQIIELPNSKKK